MNEKALPKINYFKIDLLVPVKKRTTFVIYPNVSTIS